MMRKQIPIFILLSIIILLFITSFVSAAASNCVMAFTRHTTAYTPVTYYKGETVTLDVVCTNNGGTGTTYWVAWRNSTNSIMQIDTGNPAANNVHFQITYTIPTGYGSIMLNATYNDTKTTGPVGGDNATIAATAINGLYFGVPTFSGRWLGLDLGFRITSITDYQGNKISGAQCEIGILTNDLFGSVAHVSTTAVDGTIGGSFPTSYDNFKEGTSYVLRVKCYCGLNNTDKACVNSNGVAITNSVGTTDYPFITNTWITFNEDPYPLTYSNGTITVYSNGTIISNQTYYSGYSYVYWRRNITNNYGQHLDLKIDRFLINNATNKIVDSQLDNSDAITTGAPPVINSYLIPETVTTGTYYIRRNWKVYYQGVLVATYTKDTVPFSVIGVETQTTATGVFVKDRFNGLITTHSTILNNSNEPAYNATNKLFIRAGYTAHWCVNVTNLVPLTNLSVATTVYVYLQHLSLFNPTLNYYKNINPGNKQYAPPGNSTICFDAPIPSTEIITSSDYQIQYEITQGDFNHAFDCPGCSLAMSTDYFYIIPSWESLGFTVISDPSYPMILSEGQWGKKQTTPYGSWETKINMTDSIYKNYIDPFNNIPENGWDVYAVFTEDMPNTESILNYTVTNSTGGTWTGGTEIKDMYYYNEATAQTVHVHGIGIENVNISDTKQKYFTVTVYSSEYDKRQTNAQEGLNASMNLPENATYVTLATGALSLEPSALTMVGTYKQGDILNIIHNCKNSTWSNITRITYPNSTFALNTQTAMTKNGFNYNYSFSNTNTLGEYSVYGACDEDGVNTPWYSSFNITTTGQESDNTILLFLALGGFIILIFAFVLKNNYLGFMAGVLFIIFGIFALVYGLGIISDFYTSAIGYVSLGLGLFIFLTSAYSAISDTGINLFGSKEGEDDGW
jgi:hypothetical protein